MFKICLTRLWPRQLWNLSEERYLGKYCNSYWYRFFFKLKQRSNSAHPVFPDQRLTENSSDDDLFLRAASTSDSDENQRRPLRPRAGTSPARSLRLGNLWFRSYKLWILNSIFLVSSWMSTLKKSAKQCSFKLKFYSSACFRNFYSWIRFWYRLWNSLRIESNRVSLDLLCFYTARNSTDLGKSRITPGGAVDPSSRNYLVFDQILGQCYLYLFQRICRQFVTSTRKFCW